MTIRSHGGIKTTNIIGDILGYLSPVYFNPEGITSILSLSNFNKHHRLTYDSEGGKNFTIHKEHGDILVKECAKGIFFHEISIHNSTTLTTVEQKK